MQNIFSNAVDTDRFKIEDIFFSVTDVRGVIQSANSVFCHVAQLELEKLVGAPHKIIRHPSMPRAVFRVLWDTIQSGEPIGAYVINQASDGRSYWVFALMIPIDEGYLSVRLKPSSATLDQVKALYSDLREAEDDPDYTIEAGVSALTAATAQMGFDTYKQFMTQALLTEMTSRAEHMAGANPVTLDALAAIQGAVAEVVTRAGEQRRLFEKTTQIPFNMRLQAVRMEGRDGPIGVIANNHQAMTEKLREEVTELQNSARKGAGPLVETQFLTCAMLLIEEQIQKFAEETSTDPDRRTIDKELLLETYNKFHRRMSGAVAETIKLSQKLTGICHNFKRTMSSLETTRVMCKIEQSRFDGDASGLQAIADALLVTESQFSKGIVAIEGDVLRIDKAVQQLGGVSRKAA